MRHGTKLGSRITIGLDLGDRRARYAVLMERTTIECEGVGMGQASLEKFLRRWPRALVVIEAGTHSPWVSRLVKACGHECLVANPRRLPLIYRSRMKSDPRDAERLARLGRLEPELLSPIRHRGLDAQVDLARVRTRDALVRSRTLLINHIRGTVKSFGARIPSGVSAGAFGRKAGEHLPEALRPALESIVELVAQLTEQIREYEREIQGWVRAHPEAWPMAAVSGVGPITVMSYILTLDDPSRFLRSRDVGPYVGLVPRRSSSGARDPELGITKAGDTHLRRLLVQCAHHILGRHGQDSDLRRWGLVLASRGKKNAKKRALVAVARKLAVLLHRLWVTGQAYEPLRNVSRKGAA